MHLTKQIKSEGNVYTDVSNKPSTSKPSEAKDKATSTEDSQKADMATSDKKDNQAAIGATADVNNKATQTTVPMHLQLQFQMEAIVLIKICLK